MKSVLTTYDPVQLNYAATLLTEAGIETVVLDGSLSVYETLMWPAKRLMVLADDDFDSAAGLIRDGMKAWTESEDKNDGGTA